MPAFLEGAAGLVLGVVASQPLPPLGGKVAVGKVAVVQPRESGELSVTLLEMPETGVPLQLRLRSDHVRLVQNRLGWGSVVDPQAQQPRLSARFSAPDEPGTYAVRGWLRYLTCDALGCLPRVVSITWTVEVRESGAPTGLTRPVDAPPDAVSWKGGRRSGPSTTRSSL